MSIDVTWNERMWFTAHAGDHVAQMDARPPLGTGHGMTPKELLLAALAGCTAMDVAGLLRKHKQPLETFALRVEATPSEGDHPKVFSEVRLVFELSGPIDPQGALEAVRASQTQFCGISAMLSKAFPILYSVVVNGEQVGSGRAQF
jgi:putative redox protein